MSANRFDNVCAGGHTAHRFSTNMFHREQMFRTQSLSTPQLLDQLIRECDAVDPVVEEPPPPEVRCNELDLVYAQPDHVPTLVNPLRDPDAPALPSVDIVAPDANNNTAKRPQPRLASVVLAVRNRLAQERYRELRAPPL